jgi:4-amino-4-deoxy-L-arabinose transferase-like glycosyltransferase
LKTSVAAHKTALAPDYRETHPSTTGVSAPALPHVVKSRGAEEWGWTGIAAIGALVAVGLWFRLRGLAAEGFSDDEIHTWIIAHNYLRLDFLADELEHPIATKGLVALAVSLLPKTLAPELLTRLPNALLGGLSIWLIAEVGKSLFGREAGLLAAALAAFSTTFIGYQRIAREDVLLGVLLLVVQKALVEARTAAAEQRPADARKWEIRVAIALGAMFAAKYYFFFFPMPVLAWAWTRRQAGWRISPARWAVLIGVTLATFAILDFPIFAPSTWDYLWRWTHGDHIGDRGTSESVLFMGKLYANLGLQYRNATPPWFFLVFAAVKFAVPTVLLAVVGFGIALWQRTAAHRIVIVWLAVWYVSFLITGAKYGRYFTSVAPVLFLLAAHATVVITRAASARLRTRVRGRLRFSLHRLSFAACAMLVAATEASAAVTHAPHYRLFISALGGGDARVTWFFPHCDLFDAEFREAMAAITARAEPNAEVCSETEWLARHYADTAGRTDLVTSSITEQRGCKTAQTCYVIVEPGRLYWHNQRALDQLSQRTPWHVERINGMEVARVYRLGPGEMLFSPEVATGPEGMGIGARAQP